MFHTKKFPLQSRAACKGRFQFRLFKFTLICALFFSTLLFCSAPSSAAQTDTLRILSWNIFMVPPSIFKSDQLERAAMISSVLEKSQADVIILQEAFMKKSRARIEQQLQTSYPYRTGKPPGGGLFKVNSGVWILSRLPIQDLQFIKYKACKGSDCMSGKGAYVFSLRKNNKTVWIAGTHVQSGPAPETRQKQFTQLVKNTAHVPDSLPLLIIGDLNTNLHDTAEYRAMLKTLNAIDGPMAGQAFSYHAQNDLAAKFFGEPSSTLDYILVRDNSKKIAGIRRTIHKFTSKSFGNHKFIDLSDHYALYGEVILN